MLFSSPLVSGHLIKRYKRFLADVILKDGSTVTARCPNTGSMLGLSDPGLKIWLSHTTAPGRKYPFTWELVEIGRGSKRTLVGINTSYPNTIFLEAISAGQIKPLQGYAHHRREVAYGQSSRIDLLLEDPQKGLAYVEIKNVHLMRKPGLAEFPDCKTVRGVKHLEELTRMVDKGHRAVMIYLIQRQDASKFSIAQDLDPEYAAAFVKAKKNGVEVYAAICRVSLQGISFFRLLSMPHEIKMHSK